MTTSAPERRLIAKGKLLAIAEARRMIAFAPNPVAVDHILVGMAVEAVLDDAAATKEIEAEANRVKALD